ncbi:hypothetical protein [Actinomyces sp.]
MSSGSSSTFTTGRGSARIGEDRAEVDGAQAYRLGGHDHVLRGQECIFERREE